MNRIFSKKDAGFLDQVLPVMIGILALTLVLTLMFGTIESIQTKNKVDLVARRAILLMESHGYLSDSMELELLGQLTESGLQHSVIAARGFSQTDHSWGPVSEAQPAEYGQKIEVEITGIATVSLGRDIELPVQTVRVSTSKN